MRVRAGLARWVVQVAVACAVGLAGVGLWAGPALAVQCPSRAKECRDWSKVPGRGWMKGVVCPEYRSSTVTETVRNLTEIELVLAVKNIDCWDWSNTGNPSQITGRVLDPGETATYRLEQSASSRYDLGVFVRDGAGLQRIGKMSLHRNGVGNVAHMGWPAEINILTTNTGEKLPYDSVCARQLLGEDPKRTKSTVSFNPDETTVTWIYSDGRILYGVRCLVMPIPGV